MSDFSRTLRIGELLRREISLLIQRDIKDPRLKNVSITEVQVSKDLLSAKVFYCTFNSKQNIDSEDTKRGLSSSKSYIKRVLGSRVKIRNIPDLKFLEDCTQKDAEKIDSILNRELNS
jgi:ribosome-binding factor A